MLQPAAKNWIEKYFSLIEEGRLFLNSESLLPFLEDNKTDFLHSLFFDSGIVFGYPIDFIFYKEEGQINKWTTDEKSVLLLFECFILIYIAENKKFDKEDFISQLLTFYEGYGEKKGIGLVNHLFKESPETKLEDILKSRTHIKKNISNRLWASYFENSLIYIDVISFQFFLTHKVPFVDVYHSLILGALQTVSAMAVADKKIDDTERYIISIFLESSNLKEKGEFLEKLENLDFSIKDIEIPNNVNELYKLYILDMALLTLNSDFEIVEKEREFLEQFCKHIAISNVKLEESLLTIQRFLLKNNHQIVFLQEKSTYEQVYNNFSKRWVKILGRNKDKLVEELKESKELISLVNKSFTNELNEEEKEKVKTQFKDIVKSVPALAIFMLPGGMILLPLILKIIPDLIPSAFKQNEK